MSVAESFFGARSLAASDVIVGVTQEILDYEQSRTRAGKPGIIYPNGVLTIADQESVEDFRGETPEILFAASTFYPWQGLDGLLDELRRTTAELTVHLVGELSPRDKERAAQDERVRVHGLVERADLQKLLQQSWVGLSSLALERKGMTEACTLKVREYLALGVPVYAGHRDVFPAEFPYFRVGPTSLPELLRFAQEMRSHTRRRVISAARPFIDKEELVMSLHRQLGRIPSRG